MRPIKRKPPPGQWREEPRRGRTVSDPVGQDAALVVDDVAGADHGAGTAAGTVARVYRYVTAGIE